MSSGLPYTTCFRATQALTESQYTQPNCPAGPLAFKEPDQLGRQPQAQTHLPASPGSGMLTQPCLPCHCPICSTTRASNPTSLNASSQPELPHGSCSTEPFGTLSWPTYCFPCASFKSSTFAPPISTRTGWLRWSPRDSSLTSPWPRLLSHSQGSLGSTLSVLHLQPPTPGPG